MEELKLKKIEFDDTLEPVCNIMPRLEKYLSPESLLLLNTKHDSTVLEVPNPTPTIEQPTIYKLCQFIGIVIKRAIEELKEEDYKRFAEFINYCQENNLIGYATLLPPFALRLPTPKTLFKLYVFSDFSLEKFNNIIQRDKLFPEFSSYYEGGLPRELD